MWGCAHFSIYTLCFHLQTLLRRRLTWIPSSRPAARQASPRRQGTSGLRLPQPRIQSPTLSVATCKGSCRRADHARRNRPPDPNAGLTPGGAFLTCRRFAGSRIDPGPPIAAPSRLRILRTQPKPKPRRTVAAIASRIPFGNASPYRRCAHCLPIFCHDLQPQHKKGRTGQQSAPNR